jgi:L-iditol 2-dehydrogenase
LKAVVKQQVGDGFVELVDVPEPEVTPGSVILAMGAAGICGTDVKILHGRFQGYIVPVVMGHEFAGTVVTVGSGVSNVVPGDRVVSETHAYVCNECVYCRSGRYNLCQKRKAFGYGTDGAFTKLVRVRKEIIHKLPEGVPMQDAALMEPLSVCLNALTRNSRISPGESVLVIGPGPIGLLCLQVAKLSGGRVTVVGTERNRQRLALAAKLGAESILTDVALQTGISDGALKSAFDVVVIAAGNAATFETALLAARPAGRVIVVGEAVENASFPMNLIEKKNLTVQGSFSHYWPVWEDAISLVRDGSVDVHSLITHEYEISRWRQAFDMVESREGVKVLLTP